MLQLTTVASSLKTIETPWANQWSCPLQWPVLASGSHALPFLSNPSSNQGSNSINLVISWVCSSLGTLCPSITIEWTPNIWMFDLLSSTTVSTWPAESKRSVPLLSPSAPNSTTQTRCDFCPKEKGPLCKFKQRWSHWLWTEPRWTGVIETRDFPVYSLFHLIFTLVMHLEHSPSKESLVSHPLNLPFPE